MTDVLWVTYLIQCSPSLKRLTAGTPLLTVDEAYFPIPKGIPLTISLKNEILHHEGCTIHLLGMTKLEPP